MLARYLITVALVGALGVLLMQHDPYFLGTGLMKTVMLMPNGMLYTIGISVIVVLALFGGKTITNIALAIALIFFLPDLRHPWLDAWLWKSAVFIEGVPGPAASDVYQNLRHYASNAIYLTLLSAVLLVWWKCIRRRPE